MPHHHPPPHDEHEDEFEELERLEKSELWLLRDIAQKLHRNNLLLYAILQEVKPQPRLTQRIANRFSGVHPMADNVLVFNVGDTALQTITPLDKDDNPSNGAISNVVITFTDPSATFVINPDNTVGWTPVAASTAGPANGNTACTVTDTDGVVSQWNQPFTVQVNGNVPPAQLTQSVANRFVVTPGAAPKA
jgi:hypothetical protein